MHGPKNKTLIWVLYKICEKSNKTTILIPQTLISDLTVSEHAFF